MNEIIYPPGCKDIQIELANDELIRRLKVELKIMKYHVNFFFRKFSKHFKILAKIPR